MSAMPKVGVHTHCLKCGTKLKGQQRKFCRRRCKEQHGAIRNPSYRRQRNRGIKRKLKLVELKGGCCEICGYKKNLAVLTFHHINPATKLFDIQLNNIANYKWERALAEASKCQLLCHNCHNELHHPDFDMKNLLTESHS